MGTTGANQCGSGTLCCGTIVLDGGLPGSCTTASFTATCQTSCADNPPGGIASCGSAANPLTYTLRMCNAKADCAGDSGHPNCCAYNNALISFCVNSTILTTSCKP